jgi:hypothetical protein
MRAGVAAAATVYRGILGYGVKGHTHKQNRLFGTENRFTTPSSFPPTDSCRGCILQKAWPSSQPRGTQSALARATLHLEPLNHGDSMRLFDVAAGQFALRDLDAGQIVEMCRMASNPMYLSGRHIKFAPLRIDVLWGAEKIIGLGHILFGDAQRDVSNQLPLPARIDSKYADRVVTSGKTRGMTPGAWYGYAFR